MESTNAARFSTFPTTFAAGFGQLFSGAIGKVAGIGVVKCGCEPARSPGRGGVGRNVDERGWTDDKTLHYVTLI